MSARDTILNKVRASLHVGAGDDVRRTAIAERMRNAPVGVIPARGQLPQGERVDLFCATAVGLAASVERVKGAADVPQAVADYLRSRNLPHSVRMGADPRLAAMPWHKQNALEIRTGRSDGTDEAGVSHATGAIAETGTVAMVSGGDNPTTINFLPEHHIIVLNAADIDGDLETIIARVRSRYGKGEMPRTVNLISGPSRSGDVEQKIILGAHGPRAVHVIVVGR